jgi:transcriptional regulator with XRE-family HTH domain
MVNSSDFIERLERLFQYYGLNASAFADKIQVQRSSISHLLSGRNKPSLEFVLKVVKNFPEVNLYWLLNGKGSFPSEDVSKDAPDYPMDNQEDHSSSDPAAVSNLQTHREIQKSGKSIERIVLFYSDGSFESFDKG